MSSEAKEVEAATEEVESQESQESQEPEESTRDVLVLDNLEQALVDCKSVDEVVGFCETVMAAESQLKGQYNRSRLRGETALAERLFQESQRLAEFRLRGYRRIGKAWTEAADKGLRQKKGGRRKRKTGPDAETPSFPTAQELGLDRSRIHHYVLVSEIPDTDFEDFVNEAKVNRQELTLTSAIKKAKSYRIQRLRPKTPEEILEEREENQAKTQDAVFEPVEEEEGEEEEEPEGVEGVSTPEEPQKLVDVSTEDITGNVKVFYVDPPWQKHENEKMLEEWGDMCKQLDMLASSDGAVMWLWASWDDVRDGTVDKLLETCGFEWKSEIVWDKTVALPSPLLSKQTEILVLATRGDCEPLRDDLVDLVSLRTDPKISKRPQGFYQLIESFSRGPYFEVFPESADKARKNWYFYGSE